MNDETAKKITQLIVVANKEIERIICSLDIGGMASVAIDSIDCFDSLPRNVPSIYFVTHPQHSLLYIGKARCLRMRWRAEGRRYESRNPLHQHHSRLLQIGNARLSWFPLPLISHEIAETLAIRCLKPAWNVRKSNLEGIDLSGIPSPHREPDINDYPYP